MGSSSRLDSSVASVLNVANAEVSRVNQEMAILIDSIHAGSARSKIITSVSGGVEEWGVGPQRGCSQSGNPTPLP